MTHLTTLCAYTGQEKLFSDGLAARLVSGLALQRLDFCFWSRMPLGSEDMSLGKGPRLSRHLIHPVCQAPAPDTMPELVHGRTMVQVRHDIPWHTSVSSHRLGHGWVQSSLMVGWLGKCSELQCLHVAECGALMLLTNYLLLM